ncbi:MAG: hypothetical protein Q7R49_03890 [Candidatus Daviesbacteria bacterium]|nr:hypothetical protein [Candidatus Daviesbacteria bacterium]
MLAKLFISTSLETRINKIAEILGSYSLKTNHPDVLYLNDGEKLGIEQARKIKDFFKYKPTQSKNKALVIETADKMTDEAQNALLKTIEELPENALVVLGASSEESFLPTILSRCQVTRLQSSAISQQMSDYTEEIEKLIKADLSDRFEYIEKLKEREEFFHSLLSYFHQKLPANLEFTKKLLAAERWQKQNVNLRSILEYLMLMMPS